MQLAVTRLAFALLLLTSACQRQEATSAPPPATDSSASSATSNPQLVQYHLNRAQPKLRTLKVWLGPHEIEAEMAISLTEISTGMMFRTNLADNTGMLFLFAAPRRREFYMKNCVIDLSAAYIDAEGVIDEVVELKAGVEQSVPSRSNQIKYVLEMPKGWFERKNVGVGAMLNTSQGPLKNLRGILP